MQEQVNNFSQRKHKLDEGMTHLKKQVETQIRDKKEHVIERIQQQSAKFEKAYETQVAEDIKTLKTIGELEYNFQ